MPACPACGQVNPGVARFCLACGAALAAPTSSREHRKTVTVLFCDVTGSTALGESVDPEALRALLAQYFERMRGIVERHGGAVEKFIGDAVMAVFGVPAVHEDDALRAVRAAIEMRDALPELGISARIGINTGEVVTGTEERLVTGDAVNVAARLEQAAQPNEVLIGAATLSLVRDAADVEAVEPLSLKGKAEPVQAYRLMAVRDAPGRRDDAAFVGRRRELAVLAESLARARNERRCELVTVLGDAGVGKSRLVAEFVAAADASVVWSRCLPYGEGITYWPVVEVLQQVGSLPADEAAARQMRALLGEGGAAASADEIAWAFRKTLEHAAADRPLVVVLDDIQWGEQTFLDLIEHVALLSSGAPILLLCTARPELPEVRPQWPVTLRLEPLSDDDVDELIPQEVAGGLRARIARAAGGNPLFVGEMLAMAGEANGDVVVPPSLRALLAARLDQLETADRSVLERGAVEGEVFHRGAVQALGTEGDVTSRLTTLVRRQLIRPDTPQIPTEDAFRFRHLLLRDTAYDALPKAARAELHERFARWLARHGARVVEVDELVGYHLERAFGYRAELGAADAWRALGEEAAEHLTSSGRRALSRRDLGAATTLLTRARSLLPAGSQLHRQVGLDLAAALVAAGDFDQATAILEEVERAASDASDPVQAAHARLDLAGIRISVDPEGAADRAYAEADAAMPIFEKASDELGMAKAWQLRSERDHMLARFEPYLGYVERELDHLRQAGDRSLVSGVLAQIAHAVTVGPVPVPQAIARLQAILDEVGDSPELRARVRVRMGFLRALEGREREAIDATEEAESIFEDLGVGFYLGSYGLVAGAVFQYLGRLDRAERALRRGDAAFERTGERSVRSTLLGSLARVLCDRRQMRAAEDAARLALELGSSDDFGTIMKAEGALARVLVERGDPAAEEIARHAVDVAEQTDLVWAQGDAWEDLAAVLTAVGREPEAREALREAAARFDLKGATAPAGRVRARLASKGDT